MTSCYVAANNSERKFSFYFQINRQDPHQIDGINLGTYVRLKISNKYALEYVQDLMKEKKLINYDDEVETLWKSVDGVDYVEISDPEAAPIVLSLPTPPEAPNDDDAPDHTPHAGVTVTGSKGGKKLLVLNNVKTTLKTVLKQRVNRKSNVWTFFIKNSRGGTCKLCNTDVKSSGNTTNLTNHLKRYHKNLPQNTEDDEETDDPDELEEKSLTAQKGTRNHSSTQPRIDLTLSAISGFNDKGLKANAITNALVYMIAKDDLPLSLTEKPGFKYFMKTAVALYKLPGRTSVTSTLDSKYEVLSALIKEKLSKIEHFTLTTDVWTETMTTTSYLGCTAHYIDGEELSSVVLDVAALDERHTANYLQKTIESICAKWGIPLDKVTAIVTDNGANIVKAAVDIFGVKRHLPCFAHSLNLVLTRVIGATQSLNELIVKMKSIITFFKHTAAADELRKAQRGGKQFRFIQDVATRWNSTFYMMERFLEMIGIVGSVLLKLPKSPPMITAEEVAIATEIVKILRPAENVSKELGGQKYVTSSKILSIVHCLRQAIEDVETESDIGKKFKADFIKELDHRFKNIELHSLIAIPNMLDPRFKRLHFPTNTSCAVIIDRINNLLKVDQPTFPAARQSDSPINIDNNNINNVWKYHMKLVKQKAEHETETEKATCLHAELKEFLIINKNTLPLETDPIQFWKHQKENSPKLASIALKYLCVVATSVPCERLFSLAGNVATPNRNRINGEHLSRLLFLKSLELRDWHM